MRYALNWAEARIRTFRDLSADIRLFELELLAGPTRRYQPGAHLDVSVLTAGRPETRSYSLVGLHDPQVYRIAVKRERESRGGSAYMWSLAEGARLSVTEPQTLFELDYSLPFHWLVAGGIGITPMLGMARALLARGSDFRFSYCGRDEGQMAFLAELREELGPRLSVHASSAGNRLDLAAGVAVLPDSAGLFLCGPMRLLDDARRAWTQAGRDPALLRYETFGSSGRHAPEPFWVEIPRHGLRIEVAENQTMLAALEAAGVETLSDCRRGECGLCTLDVLAVRGAIDHRDVFLSEHEHEQGERICACVSRAVGGGLVIDTAFRPD
jgi:vanillate O-demethylase ferredoxin subunit